MSAVPGAADPGPDLPRVCVIGAGSSGITAAKSLFQRGIPFDCFERGDDVGGNWLFKNSNGLSSAYRSLHINTSSRRMAYSDFPMPAEFPDFPHHSQMYRYFRGYVKHFGFGHKITFGTRVTRAVLEDGLWRVETDSDECLHYDALVVANGHHWDPRWPEPPFPGAFDGPEIHSHDYIDSAEPVAMAGKRVLVVGMGNSAMDIACELSRRDIAERLFLSARRGAWIVPNYLFGLPMDQLGATHPWLPWRVQSLLMRLALLLNVGTPWRYGLPKPDHPPLAAHPTVSQELLGRLGRGDIVPKPGIRELGGNTVVFADGSRERIDVIVYCTGYKVSFPFFDPAFVSAADNELPLWMRMMKPGIPNLLFIGLCQPLGAIMPIAEAQAEFFADCLLGDLALPDVAEAEAEIADHRDRQRRRYVTSKRHTMQVDYDRYLYDLRNERRRARRRARRLGLVS